MTTTKTCKNWEWNKAKTQLKKHFENKYINIQSDNKRS